MTPSVPSDRHEPFGRTPGLVAAVVLTIVSSAALFFWWIAVIGPLGAPAAVLVSALLGRGAVAIMAGRDREALRVRRPERGWLLPALLLVPALPIGLEIQAAILDIGGRHPATLTFHVGAARLVADAASGVVVAFLAMVIALPLTTELLFRGVIQRGLVVRWGRWRGVLAAAALAAAAHSALVAATGVFAVAIVLSAFAWSLALGHLAETTRSVVPSILTHSLMGAAWWALATLPAEPLPLVGEPGAHVPVPLLVGPLVAVGVGLWMLREGASSPQQAR